MGSRTRAMKLTPRDLASASTILIVLLLLASAASAQHATETLTSEGQYSVEAAADPGYYTGQYQHQHQAHDFYSQYSEEPQATLAGDTDRTLDFFAGAVSAPMVMGAAFMSALMGSILAPMITAGMEAVSRLPVPDIEFPRIRRKTKSKAKYNHYEERGLDEALVDSILEAVESSDYSS